MLSSLRWVSNLPQLQAIQIMRSALIVRRVSLSMDRPNMLSFTPFMNRSLSYLRESPHAAPTDKKLAAWVDLQHLSENVADAFRRGKSDFVAFEDPQIRRHVEQLSQKFENWWNNVDKNILDGKSQDHFQRSVLTCSVESILIAYHYNKARVFEVVLYTAHKVEDLRPPFLVRSGRTTAPHQPALTPAYTRTMFNLIHEAQRCIGTFLGMDLEAVRSAPVMHYIRCFYCLTVLLDLHVLCHRPSSDLSKILEAETLQIKDILQKWQDVCARAAGEQNCRSPAKFGTILANIQQWLDVEMSGQEHEDLRPMTLLNAQQVAGCRQSKVLSPGTRASLNEIHGSPAKESSVATESCVEIAVEWTYPTLVPVNDNAAIVDWHQPYQPLEGDESADASEWISQSAFGSFVPMELDQSAIAFFEGMSSDVAHSFVPTDFQYNQDDPYDNFGYQ